MGVSHQRRKMRRQTVVQRPVSEETDQGHESPWQEFRNGKHGESKCLRAKGRSENRLLRGRTGTGACATGRRRCGGGDRFVRGWIRGRWGKRRGDSGRGGI